MDPIRSMFGAYAKAFEAYDVEAISVFFQLPCQFVRGGQAEAVTTHEALLHSIGQLLDLHRAWKVQTSRMAAHVILEESEHHQIIRVTWRLGREESRVRWTYATSYVLVPDGDNRRIVSAISHDAPF